MTKHFVLEIEEDAFSWKRNETKIAEEAALDGMYVVRTSVDQGPVHHRLEGRVRAHVFLCMLAYYLEWHMRKALVYCLLNSFKKWRDLSPLPMLCVFC